MDRSQLEDLLAGVVRTGEGGALHLMPDHVPFVRVESGTILPSDGEALSSQVISDLMRDFLFEDHREQLRRGEDVEVLYTTASGERFRTSIMRQSRGLNVVFRKMCASIPSFESLTLPPVLSGLASFRRGLVLLSGFHGSGTTTTLAALVDGINRTNALHIHTVEQSIEFFHQSQQSLIHQREVGTHVASMADGVRDAARQGAEVIAIDGLGDYATLRTALEAIERGRLVVATLRASSVVGAVSEIAKLVPLDDRPMMMFRFAKLLRGITSQSLIRRKHGAGRVPVFEVLIRTRTIAQAIRDGRFHDLPELMRRGRGLGMQTSDQALRALLTHNIIASEEAAYHAVDRDFVVARA